LRWRWEWLAAVAVAAMAATMITATLMKVIGVSSEEAEPVAIEAETVTQPENTEPMPIS
jgi:hypothetical protein